MSKPAAILLLAHQGLSYLPAIAATARAQGVEVVVISSIAKDNAPIHSQREDYAELCFTEQADLTQASVGAEVEQLQRDFELLAAISTFEGYRLIVAQLNASFGAVDCQLAALEVTLDKLEMRKVLRQHQLSQINSWLLDEATLQRLQGENTVSFIKPRSGVGSFGCFKLTADTQWSDIAQLVDELHQDAFLEVAYLGNFDFIAEQFISGVECSFEVAAIDGQYFTLAMHEKTGLEARDNTILENVDVSPGITFSQALMRQGSDFVAACLTALSLPEGAFHVETRYDHSTDQWEIIEVNPRIGGGFINQSVKDITNGTSILDAWISVLLRKAPMATIKQQLAELDQQFSCPAVATIGHYIFGSPGKTLSKIELHPDKPAPAVLSEVLAVGDTLPFLSREIPVIEGLWTMPVAQLNATLDTLNAGWVDVQYQ